MRELIAVHTIGLRGKYFAPGSTIEVDADEAERLISLGAAREPGGTPEAPAQPASHPGNPDESDAEDGVSESAADNSRKSGKRR